jgi:transcriptional regulator with XRE-family HTH domain
MQFGVELRRQRFRRDLSLRELAAMTHYTRGYLSKIENGKVPPNGKLARIADAALGADGALAALVPGLDDRKAKVRDQKQFTSPEWSAEVLAFGDALSLPLELPSAEARMHSEDLWLETHYREQFDRARRLGQRLAPVFVLRTLAVDFSTLLEVAETSLLPSVRLRLLAARYAELIGWMVQETGRRDLALGWTRRSAEIAGKAGGSGFAAYALVREAELAMYDKQADDAVQFAELALRHPASTGRTRGLAAHRQAQGYALRGDHDRCLAALDRAEVLLSDPDCAGPDDGLDNPLLGSSTLGNLGQAVAGWCHYDLGRPQRAAELLEGALTRTSATAHRSRALYGARLALAYEASGELDRMQAVTLQAVENANLVRSASAYGELRELSRALTRRHNVRALRDLRCHVDEALVHAN